MAKITCKNPTCNKTVKTYGAEFCSTECFGNYRSDNQDVYNKGTFKIGHNAWNKGKRFTKVGDTFIRKKTTKAGAVRDRRFTCIGFKESGVPKYIRTDKYNWLLARGPVPKGHVLYPKDGRTLNDDISNLECISLGAALSRYSLEKKKILNLRNKNHISKIIEGCESGNRRIQKQLYEMMYSKCMSIIYRYVKDEDMRKELLNIAFTKVFKNISSVKVNKGNLEGWICRVVVNTSIDHVRKYNKIDYVTDSIDEEFEDGINTVYNKISINEDFSEQADGEYILEIIQDLSPAYKLVFNLHVIEGFGHKEIASQLGITEGTSKSNLSKAKLYLKNRIIDFYKKEEAGIAKLEEYIFKEELEYC